ncbi:MAG: hypothetical protein V4685_11395 [Bacteroidota bacterium]
MPAVQFEDAREMTIRSYEWMSQLSEYIKNSQNTPPADCFQTQKLAFEISTEELSVLAQQHRVVGILGMEEGSKTLTVILASLDENNKPVSLVLPLERWSVLNTMDELQIVLDNYLDPK